MCCSYLFNDNVARFILQIQKEASDFEFIEFFHVLRYLNGQVGHLVNEAPHMEIRTLG